MKAKNHRRMNDKLKGFTLVELIVVITILVILGTIAFTSLTGFQGSARDSDRVTTLKNIDSGLSLFQLKTGYYPLPEANGTVGVLTGSINGTIYAYLGVIGDLNTRNIKMNKIPTDPLSSTSYVYGVSRDKKYYQVATVLENTEAYNLSPIVSTVYADASYQARVNGDYPGYLKFTDSSGSIWIANVPSLLWNNTGSVSLLSTGTYFVVNKQANLPYKLDVSSVIQNKDGNQMIQAITGTGVATLTGVNISSVTTSTGVSSLFTGSLLASFGGNVSTVQSAVLGNTVASAGMAVSNDCTLSGTVVAHGTSVTAYSENTIVWNAVYDCTARQQTRTCSNGTLSGSGTYQYNSCVKGTPNSCSASGSYVLGNGHTYSIPTLSHGSGAVNILSANVSENNGTFQYTLSSVTCNDGVYVSVSESGGATVQGCNGGYGINGNTCSASQAGSCNNTVALGCGVGSAINDNGLTSCGTTRMWNCSGLYGGGNSVQCSLGNGSCQSNPTGLSLSHTTRNKTFTFSWTAGVGNGGSCKLQYNKNGTWTNINETIHNCDSTLSNVSVTLPGDSWYSGNWNGVGVRIMRTNDSTVLGTLGSLFCSNTSGSASSTPSVDEDCNGVWDNTAVSGGGVSYPATYTHSSNGGATLYYYFTASNCGGAPLRYCGGFTCSGGGGNDSAGCSAIHVYSYQYGSCTSGTSYFGGAGETLSLTSGIPNCTTLGTTYYY